MTKQSQPKQQVLFESIEDKIIESLYGDKETPEQSNQPVCPECDSELIASYDRQDNVKYFCDNCDCYVKGTALLLTSDRDIALDTEA